jgi:hypothetical protein
LGKGKTGGLGEKFMGKEYEDRGILERLEEIERRLWLLEEEDGLSSGPEMRREFIKVYLVLPEAEIGGLRFDRKEVKAVFVLKDDGWYHSQDILFVSARNAGDYDSRDILFKYLNSEAVKGAFLRAVNGASRGGLGAEAVELSLPVEETGVKKYNGVSYWYWLQDSCGVGAYKNADGNGVPGWNAARDVGGCAPKFRIVREVKNGSV